MSIEIHYRPFKDSHNVRCLNGSAHARRTLNIDEVTCPKCKDENHNKDYWDEHGIKYDLKKKKWKLSAMMKVIYDEVYRPNTAQPCAYWGFGLDELAHCIKGLSETELQPLREKAEKLAQEYLDDDIKCSLS